MIVNMRDVAEWQIAHDSHVGRVPPVYQEGIERAMWEAYKIGYMRARQELGDPQTLRRAFEHIYAFAQSKTQATQKDEQAYTLREMLNILSTEPRFEP